MNNIDDSIGIIIIVGFILACFVWINVLCLLFYIFHCSKPGDENDLNSTTRVGRRGRRNAVNELTVVFSTQISESTPSEQYV